MSRLRLENWSLDPYKRHILWGNVYSDNEKNRFKDGDYIHTSTIMLPPIEELKEGSIVATLNSVYLLGKELQLHENL